MRMHLMGLLALASLMATPSLSFSIAGGDESAGSGGDPTPEPETAPVLDETSDASTPPDPAAEREPHDGVAESNNDDAADAGDPDAVVEESEDDDD